VNQKQRYSDSSVQVRGKRVEYTIESKTSRLLLFPRFDRKRPELRQDEDKRSEMAHVVSHGDGVHEIGSDGRDDHRL